MNRTGRVLLFSRKDIGLIEKWRSAKKDRDTDYIYASSPDAIYSLMAEHRFDLLIFDVDESPSQAELLDIVRHASRSGLPVIVTHLQTEIPPHLLKTAETDGWLHRKLVLQKKRPEMTSEYKERLDIVSRTAATLSHEINNPLLAITANVEMLLKNGTALDDDMLGKIRVIEMAADRIRKVTERLIDIDSISFRNTAAGKMICFSDSHREANTVIENLAEIAE